MDIGVADESLNGIPYEESSESEEEEEAEEAEGEDRTFNSNRDFRVFLRAPFPRSATLSLYTRRWNDLKLLSSHLLIQ